MFFNHGQGILACHGTFGPAPPAQQTFTCITTTLTCINTNVDVVAVVANCPRRPVSIHDVIIDVAAEVLIVVVIIVVFSCPVAWRPLHLVLLLESPTGVGEPGRDLGQGHLGDDREHDLLALGWVRVLDVLVEPGLERAG